MTGAEFGGVDIDLLADYIGGALEGTPEESAVAARIADDPTWQAAYDSLTAGMTLVTADLTRLPPEPMPLDLATRLDEMFRTTPLHDTTAGHDTTLGLDTAASRNGHPEAGGHVASDSDMAPDHGLSSILNASPSTSAHRRPNSADGTTEHADSAADHAATEAVTDPAPIAADHAATEPEPIAGDHAATGTVTEPGPIAGDHAGTGTDITDPAPIAGDLAAPPVPHLAVVRGPGASEGGRPDVPQTERKRRLSRRRMKWATPIAIAAGFVAFVGFSLDYLSGQSADDTAAQSTASDSGGGSAELAAPAAGAVTIASGTNYTRATLAVSPVGVLNAPAPAAGNASANKDAAGRSLAEKNDPLARLLPAPALQACLDEIQRENGGEMIAVESVDYARFDGKPAIVVRFSAANGQWAWASGPACGTPEGGAATLGNVPVR